MAWVLGRGSKKHLEGVHPDLVRVVVRTLEISKYDFGITDGVRTNEEQLANIASGASISKNSKHLIQKDGYSHAIDFMVYFEGKGTWDIKYYRKVIQAFFTSAIELGVQVESGGLWESFVDGPHIQLGSFYRE